MDKINIKINLILDESQKGIWKYSSYLDIVPQEFRLSLDEGNTKEEVFEDNIILKREDQNPTGSLKDRGMAYLISKAYSLGQKDLVCPSSGNAAISASVYANLANLNLTVFISPKTDKGKINELKKRRVNTVVSERPISDSLKFAKENNFYNLRPSQNVYGSEGYQTIAFEIVQNQGNIEDLFLPVSSGVAMLGIIEGFIKIGLMPRFHICQSTAVCPMASLFDKDYVVEKESIATSLVAKTSAISEKLMELVKESKGSGWVINNNQILDAQKKLKSKRINTSNEGALALAAIYKAKEKGWKLGKTVCLLTGKRY